LATLGQPVWDAPTNHSIAYVWLRGTPFFTGGFYVTEPGPGIAGAEWSAFAVKFDASNRVVRSAFIKEKTEEARKAAFENF
jgi:hypothetical protein